jgi:hypothetical protein
MSMQILRERLERDEYQVDPGKVAEAILARLLAMPVTSTAPRGRRQCS